MTVKVSVVIPVYNSENYIERCIQSLLNQQLNHCEFIFINDGSTDRSKQIIERYKKLDSRILLINQSNKGVSAARNAGLSLCRGDYIGFVDADDEVKGSMFEILYNKAAAGDIDLLISNFESGKNLSNPTKYVKYAFPESVPLSKNMIVSYLLEKEDCNSVCNKLYKRSLLKKYNIKFPSHLSHGEDGFFNLNVSLNSVAIEYINFSGYLYRDVPGSATRNMVHNDYFKKALSIYHHAVPEKCFHTISKSQVELLQSKKLIKNVISYTYLYYSFFKTDGFKQKNRYVYQMITHPEVRKALATSFPSYFKEVSKYEKALLIMIKIKSIIGIYVLMTYSLKKNNQM
ncbi:glycosyltransferase family 2 protein [Halobacillus litoralis]|uniref:glycosyltransferase family 2 protein n=1 Tax=Halobacillus litoralis TaxID=45668 RepID=UPI001CFCD25A|nr:glycosyltransferase family 2 protein [Halobacillus litoralis]WLR49140.1 glycosyltransferase family 2 protein [Halobacillus litoralis]